MKQLKLILLSKIENKSLFYSFIFISHPLLLYLIIMIIYFLLFIYFFADPILCQGLEELTSLPALQEAPQERLDTLEIIWKSDLDKLENATKDFNNWINTYKEAITRPERTREIEHYICHRMEDGRNETIRCLSKFRHTEEMIKTHRPEYISHLPKQWFE